VLRPTLASGGWKRSVAEEIELGGRIADRYRVDEVLGHLFPEPQARLSIRPRPPSLCSDPAQGGRTQCGLIAAPAFTRERTCLTLAVDDFERCDPASISVLAELSPGAERHALLLMLALRSRDDGSRVELPAAFGDRCASIELGALVRGVSGAKH
jgi:hypothetical protein